jgi:hypothetical protein
MENLLKNHNKPYTSPFPVIPYRFQLRSLPGEKEKSV